MSGKVKVEKKRVQPRRNGGARGGVASAGAAVESRGARAKPSERIDEHIASIADWRGKVLATIRRIMLEADPAVTEDWKWMGSPVWYCDGMIAVANAHREKVKCTFSRGAHLGVDQLFNAGLGGREWRAIDVFEKDRLDEAALRRLVKTAIAYNRSQQKSKEKGKAVGADGGKVRRAGKKA
jgi:hypothetical protein